jgi:anti-anti-sigma regulatory factor
MSDQKVFGLTGTLDRPVEDVERAVAAGGNNVVLDLKATTFITVDGLEWLEELLLRANSVQSDVRFTNVPPSVYKVFKVAHINSLLASCGSPAANAGPVC